MAPMVRDTSTSVHFHPLVIRGGQVVVGMYSRFGIVVAGGNRGMGGHDGGRNWLPDCAQSKKESLWNASAGD